MPKIPKSKSNYINDKSQTTTTSSFQALMSFYTTSLSSVAAELPYKFTLSLADLLVPKLKSNGSPIKPQSAFMLFLRDYIEKLSQQYPNQISKSNLKEISYCASKVWDIQPSHVIQFFDALYKVAKELYNTLYPGYDHRSNRKFTKIKTNENKENKENMKDSMINHNNTTINNHMTIPIINHSTNSTNFDSFDSFPNLDVDFELYDEPKEDEMYFSLFPTSHY